MTAVTKSLLVTGPIEGAERYADAARSVGWEANVHPLLEIRPIQVDLTAEMQRADLTPNWLCVTSRHALASVEACVDALPNVRCATVGASSAKRLLALGLNVALEASSSATELADRLGMELTSKSSVLWPRGSRSDELARLLRAQGADVLDPVVYETVEREHEALPATSAVFFASPSAVEAWIGHANAPRPETVIAIGATTGDAVERHAEHLPEPRVLDAPWPEALGRALAEIEIS